MHYFIYGKQYTTYTKKFNLKIFKMYIDVKLNKSLLWIFLQLLYFHHVKWILRTDPYLGKKGE